MAVSAPRPKPTTRYHKGLDRNDILDAALEILREGVFERLTLAAVAKRLGVSAPAVYHHFASKDALFAATAALGFRHLTSIYEQTGRDVSDLKTWIAKRGTIYLLFAFEEPALHHLMYRYRFEDRHAFPELIEAEDACFNSSVSRIAYGSVRKPRFGSQQSVRDHPVSMTIWATFHGLATIIADGHMRIRNKSEIAKMATEVAAVLTQQNQFELIPADD